MREDVVCRPGFAWWLHVCVGGGAAILGLAWLVGWVPGDLPYGHLGAAGMILGGGIAVAFAVTGWQRFTATPRGLMRERVGKRDVVPWSELGTPDVREIEPDLLRPDLDAYMGHGIEAGMHITTYRDRQGRIVCSIGPRFTNRPAFVAAVRRYVRETRTR